VIKAVVFDLDGVYFRDGKKNFIKKISERFNVDEKSFEYFFVYSDLMMRYKMGELSKDGFWSKIISKWHIKCSTEELLRILKESYNIYPKTVQLIKKLRKIDIKTITCSNNFKERIEVLQEKFDFLKNFDFVVLSYDYGMLKPALLKKVLELSKFKPEEIVIIDDNEKTIEYAKRNGFETIYCENPDKLENEFKKLGIL
jgi:HAD superfamily hydrolase (TIGR01509 family)